MEGPWKGNVIMTLCLSQRSVAISDEEGNQNQNKFTKDVGGHSYCTLFSCSGIRIWFKLSFPFANNKLCMTSTELTVCNTSAFTHHYTYISATSPHGLYHPL